MYKCSCGGYVSIAPSKNKCANAKSALAHLQKCNPEKGFDFVQVDGLWHIKETN